MHGHFEMISEARLNDPMPFIVGTVTLYFDRARGRMSHTYVVTSCNCYNTLMYEEPMTVAKIMTHRLTWVAKNYPICRDTCRLTVFTVVGIPSVATLSCFCSHPGSAPACFTDGKCKSQITLPFHLIPSLHRQHALLWML